MSITTRRSLMMIFLFALPIASCTGCLVWALQPLSPARQSDETIREEILRATPLGSKLEAVEAYVKSRFGGPSVWLGDSPYVRTHDGRKNIWVVYGYYCNIKDFPLATGVDVVWDFSKDDVLIEVRVSRSRNAIGTG